MANDCCNHNTSQHIFWRGSCAVQAAADHVTAVTVMQPLRSMRGVLLKKIFRDRDRDRGGFMVPGSV